MEVYAYMNHGRWLADCPKCMNASRVKPGRKKFICLACHPKIIATAYVEARSHSGPGAGRRILRPVADHDLRADAMRDAQDAGEAYNLIFPREVKEIERILIPVRDVRGKCWYPDRDEIRALHPTASAFGQSLADLREEVSRYGIR